MRSTRRDRTQPRDVVTLRDLAPRAHVVGGAARRLFGAEPNAPSVNAITERASAPLFEEETTMKKIADLQPNAEQAANVKGGYLKTKTGYKDPYSTTTDKSTTTTDTTTTEKTVLEPTSYTKG